MSMLSRLGSLRIGATSAVLVLALPSVAKGTPPLRVPWPCEVTYPITQGHQTGSHVDQGAYAWDIGIPEGGEVVAPADGVVRRIRMDSTAYGCSSEYGNDANYVVIDFGDGTEALLMHLQAGSSSLGEGDFVTQGEVVARVGLSGWVCGAHLHFQIQSTCASWYCQSIPSTFEGLGDPGLGASIESANCPLLPPCAPLDGAEVIYDDRDACFFRETNYWWTSPDGYAGSHRYTFGTPGPADETVGTFRFDVLTGGTYQIAAHIPELDATSENARYFADGGEGATLLRAVNQNTEKGWQNLGELTFLPGTGRTVRLGDNTGESPDSDRKLAYDAIRLTPVIEGSGGAGGEGPGVGGGLVGGASEGGAPGAGGSAPSGGSEASGGETSAADGEESPGGCGCAQVGALERDGHAGTRAFGWAGLVLALAARGRRRVRP